jgi:hypothetical protein
LPTTCIIDAVLKVSEIVPADTAESIESMVITQLNMRTCSLICGCLLLVSTKLVTASGAIVTEDSIGADPIMPEMESIELDEETSNAVSGAEVGVQKFWWGLPYPWWPTSFCKWDYWTTAAISGNAVSCTDQTGKATGAALAKLARQALTTNRQVLSWFPFRRIGGVSTNSVLCARVGTKTLRYTVQLKGDRATLTVLRQRSAPGTLRNVFTRITVASALRTVEGEWTRGHVDVDMWLLLT